MMARTKSRHARTAMKPYDEAINQNCEIYEISMGAKLARLLSHGATMFHLSQNGYGVIVIIIIIIIRRHPWFSNQGVTGVGTA